MNGGESIKFNYLHDFNLRLGNQASYMFTPEGVKNIQEFKALTMASNNMIDNFCYTPGQGIFNDRGTG